MLKQDIIKLKNSLKQYRRPRQLQTQFPNTIIQPPSSTTSLTSLPQNFANKFPKLSYHKQILPYEYSYCTANYMNSLTYTNTNITKSEKDYSEFQKQQKELELNKEDQDFWRKHYGNIKLLPIIQSQAEIKKIIECFKVLQGQDKNILFRAPQQQKDGIAKKQKNRHVSKLQCGNIYDKLHEIYVQKGGDKNYEEFKQKIQSDVLTLVSREVQKRKNIKYS